MSPPQEVPSLQPLGAFVGQYRPLVLSVCRRLLRGQQDVEDACQETFARLVRHAGILHGSPSAWLAATARSVCLEMIRREVRERRRRTGFALSGGGAPAVSAQRIALLDVLRRELPAAIGRLAAVDARLIVRRFLHREPLRAIAADSGQSLATVSRHARQALSRLAESLKSAGIVQADERTLMTHFADPVLLGADASMAEQPLRFAADWRAAERTIPAPPGTRRLRVGAMIGYQTTRTPGAFGILHAIEEQVWTAGLMDDPDIELVAIVERDTTALGAVERTMREYELTAGLIAADDVEGLLTLDVILMGISFAIDPRITAAINTAVRAGVGLLNEFWTGLTVGGDAVAARELMLAATPVYAYHEPPFCDAQLPARVIAEHPLLPGLREGDELMVGGCGPAFATLPGTTTCIRKNRPIPSSEHGLTGVGELSMPVLIIGQLGRGRVVWSGLWKQDAILERLTVAPQQYIRGVLHWLAKPREPE